MGAHRARHPALQHPEAASGARSIRRRDRRGSRKPAVLFRASPYLGVDRPPHFISASVIVDTTAAHQSSHLLYIVPGCARPYILYRLATCTHRCGEQGTYFGLSTISWTCRFFDRTTLPSRKPSRSCQFGANLIGRPSRQAIHRINGQSKNIRIAAVAR